ncbi:MAG TPA: BatA domain-containing protein [Cyclobacteriaceae bacterium]|nr:BatA domain-containing protein [Cyclobacteriaceae bacterium]
MFSNPLYLFSLAGLAIPLVIHLLSRKEGKVIKLGSVRHVVETSTQQFKGIKLNELVLLALRCAMIIVFSLLLSGLQCTSRSNEKWVIVEKELHGYPNLPSILDSLEDDNYSLHLLANGFPKLKDSSGASTEVNYWQLVEELKQKNLSDAIVFSKNNVTHFKGLRISLPENIRWISQPSSSVDFPIRAVRISKDSAILLTGHSSSDKTYFSTEKISSNTCPVPIISEDTIKIVLVADSEFNFDKKIIKAALLAIEKLLVVKIKLIETDPSKELATQTDWCLWLSSKKIDGVKAKNVIRIAPSAIIELIVKEGFNQWTITKRLNQEVALHDNLTVQLATLLLTEEKVEGKINVIDRRMVSDSLAWSNNEGDKEIQASIQHVSADNYLIGLLLVLLIIERVIAYQRNQ